MSAALHLAMLNTCPEPFWLGADGRGELSILGNLSPASGAPFLGPASPRQRGVTSILFPPILTLPSVLKKSES